MALDIVEPTAGQLNWDVPLNSVLTQIDTDATNALSNLANHSSNVPADPHGDRAFAQSLVSPITTGVNSPNGYVKLDSTGHIPASLISGTSAGGMYTKVFDAVGLYGMTPGTSDTSAQLQSALTAAANAGGGIVYVGPGLYSLANYVIIGSNTWLLLSEGTTLQRITGSSNPPYLISNVQFGTTNTPSTHYKISGGMLDAVGTQGLSSACTPIFNIQATKIEIRDVWINNVYNNPAIEVNGCSVVRMDWLHLDGAGSPNTQATVPAIRINSSETATTPPGLATSLYNGTSCSIVKISNCDTQAAQNNFGCYGTFAASDLNPVHKSSFIIITGCSTAYNSLGNNPVVTAKFSSYSLDNNLWSDTAGGWTNMTLQNGFTAGPDANGNSYPPQYKINADGTLAIRGIISMPGGFSVTGQFAVLPQPFANNFTNPPSCPVTNPTSGYCGSVYIKSGGDLHITGNFPANFNVYLDGTLRIV